MNEDTRELSVNGRYYYLIHPPRHSRTPSPPLSADGGPTWENTWDDYWNNYDNNSALFTAPESALSSSEQTQLLLYDIFIPLLGSLIIVLNLAVVISSLLLLRKGLIVSTTIVSVYSVGLIAVDRYLYIMYGLQYQRYITPGRARLLIVATWFLGLVIGFLPAFGWRGDTEGGRICWFIRLAPPPLVILTTVLGIIPVFVVVVLYSIILHKAIRRVAQLKKASREQQGAALAGNLRLFRGGGGGQSTDTEQPLAEPSQQRRSSRKTSCCGCCGGRSKTTTTPQRDKNPTRKKAVKVVMLTTGSFVVTWLPYFIASTMFVLCDPETNADLCRGLQFAIASPLAILGFTNSLLNPVIYAWWHQGFRTSAKRLWTKLCPCCHKSSSQNPRNPAAPVPAPRATSSSDLPRDSNATASTSMSSHDEDAAVTSYRSNNKPVPHHRSVAATSDLENRITPVPSIRQTSSVSSSSTTTRL